MLPFDQSAFVSKECTFPHELGLLRHHAQGVYLPLGAFVHRFGDVNLGVMLGLRGLSDALFASRAGERVFF